MSQISPPIRILLVCAVAFMAAWMLFLKPNTEVPVDPPAPAPNVQTDEPAVSTPGQVVEAAQEAVDGAPASETEAGAPAVAVEPGAPAAAAAPVSAAELKGVPKPLAKAIRDEKALVVLFWNNESADDRAVRAALRDVNRWNGRVFVHVAPLSRISDYGRIARGVDVTQSPTVVVADPQLRAETLVGYVDTLTIDQAVLDALRNSTGMFTSQYLRDINGVCARFADSLWAMPHPENTRQLGTYVKVGSAKAARFASQFRAVKAPKRFRSLRAATVRDNAAYAALYSEWAAFLGANPAPARILASVDRFGGRERALTRRYNRRMDAQNVLSCGSQS